MNTNNVETYDLDFALRIAKLWRAGKMIGGDPDTVRNTLLAEVERLHALMGASKTAAAHSASLSAEEAAKRLGYESFNYAERS